MRKGDEKRQEVLNTAERLFCQRGYDGTSVQDILSEMSLSKGGFYHHFASKDEVLKALCERRSLRMAEFTEASLNDIATPMGRINAVLHGFMPLRREETAFMSLVLPMIDRPEGHAIAMTYQDALVASFQPLLRAEMAAAASVDVICPPVADMERVILHVLNRCWLDLAELLLYSVREGQRCDQLSLLNIREKYRRAIEVLMDAPYGSIEIIRVEEWDEVVNNIKLA